MCYPAHEYPDQMEYLLIDASRSRCVASHTLNFADIPSAVDPYKQRRLPVYVWYEQTENGALMIRNRLCEEMRKICYRLSDSTIYWKWTKKSDEQAWTRINEDQIPEWFFTLVKKAYDKMDYHEKKAEQGS